MALRLTLKPHERVIVNGCILKNGARRQVLEVENRADILRGEEMLDAARATTPARRIAYQIQIALVSPSHRDTVLPVILTALDQLAQTLPRWRDAIAEVEVQLQGHAYYQAFRLMVPFFAQEDLLLGHAPARPAPSEIAP